MISFKRSLLFLITCLLVSLSFNGVQAGMVSNDRVLNSMSQTHDKASLIQTINRAEVREQLASLGVNTSDLEVRINQMTHAEITELNEQMSELPAGAGALGLVVTVFIVFVITDVIGATDIFPFIDPVT